MLDPGLQRQLEALGHLHHWLRAAGFPVGVDTWIHVHDLLLHLHGQGRLPTDPAALRPLLAPLFVTGAEQQRRFHALYDHWLAAPRENPASQTAAVEAVIRSHQPPQGPHIAEKPARDEPERDPWKVPLLLFAAALLAGSALWWVLAPQPAAPRQSPPPPPGACPPDCPGSRESYLELPLLPLPADLRPAEFEPPPQDTPPLMAQRQQQLARLRQLILVLPWAALGLWLLARWRRRWLALRRRPRDRHNPLRHLRLRAPPDDMFSQPALSATLRGLHRSEPRPTRILDGRASVEASLRHPGRFVPVYWDRPEVPEVVVLAQYRHAADPFAGMAGIIVERLRDSGLSVYRYDYRHDPRLLLPAQGRRAPIRLTELRHRHGEARLILIGAALGLVDDWRRRPHAWTRSLDHWTWRGLLSTGDRDQTWRNLLSETGLVSLPLSDEGLNKLIPALVLAQEHRRIAPALRDLPATAPPPTLLRDSDRWSGPLTPLKEDRERLHQALRAYLGVDGLSLLAALAAYPQLDFGLTRALDAGLFPRPGQGARREQRLQRLARLPWMGRGWLPDWLRSQLLNGLPEDRRTQVRALYETLFRRLSHDPHGVIVLPIALPSSPRRDRQTLRAWFGGGRRAGVYGDAVFADLMLSAGQKLDFRLPGGLALGLPAGLGRVWRTPLFGAACAGLVTGLLFAALHLGGGHSLEGLYRKAQRDAFATIPVRIDVSAGAGGQARAMGEALRTRLTAMGLPVAWDSRPVAGPLSGTTARLSHGPGVDPAVINHVRAQTARTLGLTTDQLPRFQDAKTAGIAIRLDPRAQAGDPITLRDPLSRPLDEDQRRFFRAGAAAGGDDTTTDPVPGTTFRDPLRDGGEGPRMRVLPAGRFLMGSPEDEPGRFSNEGPRHEVRIERRFALGVTEVTFDDYDRFARATGRTLPEDEGWGRGNRPVINVSWEDARAYAAWLGEQTGQRYRLPSEAEWEYAARAGTRTRYFWGDDPEAGQACRFANGYDRTGKTKHDFPWPHFDCEDGAANTAPVDRYDRNAFGLADMLGNVWEWTADCWHENYANAPLDGTAWREADGGDCGQRVVRGGGWDFRPENLRAAFRFRVPSGVAVVNLGFRVARAF